MSKLLVLAAGVLQIPVIKKAQIMGHYVIAADGNSNALGFKYADKAICVNITSEDEMLRVARSEQIDGVIHPCSEVAMAVMGRINDELGLSGISREQALRATNKYLMREAFKFGGAPSPLSIITQTAEDAWFHFQNFDTCSILKPSRSSGSRGIAKIPKSISQKSFLNFYERALVESRDKTVLIEQFIEGPEFSVEIIVWDSNIHVLAVTDKKTTEDPFFVELGHTQPSCFASEFVKIVTDAAVSGVKALGVNNCACHAEVKLQNGIPYLMEIGARLGGDFISTELTHLSTGIDMVAAAVNCALGVEPYLFPSEEASAACIRYFSPDPGKLVDIRNLELLQDKRVYDSAIYYSLGDIIPELTSSLCRSGHVIIVEETPQRAIDFAEELIEKIKFVTVNA
ncbi:MAG: ATP-grasp domain-containing protein [Bacteroidales bacterium]|nr:ATP-grasp domain-containing protein [Bacteroidales bacterium]